MKLLIRNHYPYHYEIIESVIIKYQTMLNIDDVSQVDIYLSLSVKGNRFIHFESIFVKNIHVLYSNI